MLIPKITAMIVKTLFMKLGRTGGPSTTTKPPSQSSTFKPTSVSGNLHADTWNQRGVQNNTSWFDRENRGTIYDWQLKHQVSHLQSNQPVYQVTCMLKVKQKYCMPIPEINVVFGTTLVGLTGKTGGPSTTTKPSTGLATIKPTSVSGNLHAESKT